MTTKIMTESNMGEALRAARKRAKLTQQQAADKAGLSRCHWTLVENGGGVTVSTATIMFSVCGVDLDWMRMLLTFREPD